MRLVYNVYDDDNQIESKQFDNFPEALEYAKQGLITYICEEDLDCPECEERVVWTWDSTWDDQDAIENLEREQADDFFPMDEDIEISISGPADEVKSLAELVFDDAFDVDFDNPTEEIEVECPDCADEFGYEEEPAVNDLEFDDEEELEVGEPEIINDSENDEEQEVELEVGQEFEDEESESEDQKLLQEARETYCEYEVYNRIDANGPYEEDNGKYLGMERRLGDALKLAKENSDKDVFIIRFTYVKNSDEEAEADTVWKKGDEDIESCRYCAYDLKVSYMVDDPAFGRICKSCLKRKDKLTPIEKLSSKYGPTPMGYGYSDAMRTPMNSPARESLSEQERSQINELFDLDLNVGIDGGDNNDVSVLSSYKRRQGKTKLDELLDADINLSLDGGTGNNVNVLSPLGEETKDDGEKVELTEGTGFFSLNDDDAEKLFLEKWSDILNDHLKNRINILRLRVKRNSGNSIYGNDYSTTFRVLESEVWTYGTEPKLIFKLSATGIDRENLRTTPPRVAIDVNVLLDDLAAVDKTTGKVRPKSRIAANKNYDLNCMWDYTSIEFTRFTSEQFENLLTKLVEEQKELKQSTDGRKTKVKAEKRLSEFSPEELEIARNWFRDHIEKIEFNIVSGSPRSITGSPRGNSPENGNYDLERNIRSINNFHFDDIDDAIDNAILERQTQFLNDYGITHIKPSLDNTGKNIKIGTNIYLNWRRAQDDVQNHLTHYITNFFNTCKIYFDTEIKNAPKEVLDILKDAVYNSDRTTNNLDNDKRFIQNSLAGEIIVNKLFNSDLDFLSKSNRLAASFDRKSKTATKNLKEGLTNSEFAEYMQLCKEIGIKGNKDLESFMKEVGLEPGCPAQDLLQALREYRAELGPDFKIINEERKSNNTNQYILGYHNGNNYVFWLDDSRSFNAENFTYDLNNYNIKEFDSYEQAKMLGYIADEQWRKETGYEYYSVAVKTHNKNEYVIIGSYKGNIRYYDYDQDEWVDEITETCIFDNYTEANETKKYVNRFVSTEPLFMPLYIDQNGNIHENCLEPILSENKRRSVKTRGKTFFEETKLATNKKGDYLVAAESGKGYTVFNRNNVYLGGFDGEDDQKAIDKFNKGEFKESLKESLTLPTMRASEIKDELDLHGDITFDLPEPIDESDEDGWRGASEIRIVDTGSEYEFYYEWLDQEGDYIDSDPDFICDTFEEVLEEINGFYVTVIDLEEYLATTKDERFELSENFTVNNFNIPGFELQVTNEFEDEGVKGFNVIYSKDGVDIVEIEIWELDSPISVIKNLYRPNLMNSIYDSFDGFAADLEYKVERYFTESLAKNKKIELAESKDYYQPNRELGGYVVVDTKPSKLYGKYWGENWEKKALDYIKQGDGGLDDEFYTSVMTDDLDEAEVYESVEDALSAIERTISMPGTSIIKRDGKKSIMIDWSGMDDPENYFVYEVKRLYHYTHSWSELEEQLTEGRQPVYSNVIFYYYDKDNNEKTITKTNLVPKDIRPEVSNLINNGATRVYVDAKIDGEWEPLDKYTYDPEWTPGTPEYAARNGKDFALALESLDQEDDLTDQEFAEQLQKRLQESQSQEISSEYNRLSKKYGIDFENLVYGEEGFMKTKYPNNFPDFAGDVIYSEKYWNELVEFAKEKGIELN